MGCDRKEGHHLGKTKILIADAHPIVREGTHQLMEQETDLVVVASSSFV